jgi:hypothetical protein
MCIPLVTCLPVQSAPVFFIDVWHFQHHQNNLTMYSFRHKKIAVFLYIRRELGDHGGKQSATVDELWNSNIARWYIHGFQLPITKQVFLIYSNKRSRPYASETHQDIIQAKQINLRPGDVMFTTWFWLVWVRGLNMSWDLDVIVFLALRLSQYCWNHNKTCRCWYSGGYMLYGLLKPMLGVVASW